MAESLLERRPAAGSSVASPAGRETRDGQHKTHDPQHGTEHDTERWLAVLDVLERSLDDAERLLTDPTVAVVEHTTAADGWRTSAGGAVSAGVPVPGSPGTGAPGRGATGADPWSPPAGVGPLPPYLTGRVQRLVVRHRATVALLEAARGTTARHLTAVRAVRPAGGAPTYVDVSG